MAGIIVPSASLLEGLGGTLVVAEATSFGWRARRGERRADEVDIHPVFVAFGIEVISLGRFGGLQELASRPSHRDLTQS